MAKHPTSKEDPRAPGGAAVADQEPAFEIPVIEKTDEELLLKVVEAADEPQGEDEEAEKPDVEATAEPKKPAEPKPKAEAKPKPEPTSAAEPTAEVKAEAKPEARSLTPIERAEREKRKKYAALWQQAEEEKERLQARLSQLQREPRVAEARIAPERIAALKQRLKDVTELGDVAEAAIQEMAQVIQERDKRWQEAWELREADLKFRLSWLDAKLTHKDFEHVVRTSGLYEAICLRGDGTYADPYLARRVYLAADPGEEAYALAVGRLEHEASKNGGRPDGEVEATAESAPQAAPKPAPTVEPKADAEEAEAERRGARKVIEQVESIAKKPRGIANLRSAGGVKTRWTREELTALMRSNPEGYLALTRKYPDLERFHLS